MLLLITYISIALNFAVSVQTHNLLSKVPLLQLNSVDSVTFNKGRVSFIELVKIVDTQ